MPSALAAVECVPRACGDTGKWNLLVSASISPAVLRSVAERGDHPHCVSQCVPSWGAWSVGAAGDRRALPGLWARPCLQQPSILSHTDPGFQLCHRKMLPEGGWQLASQQRSPSLLLQQRCFHLIFLNIDLFCIFIQNKQSFQLIFLLRVFFK